MAVTFKKKLVEKEYKIAGCGCFYGNDDMCDEFLKNGIAAIGWNPSDRPAIHDFMKTLKFGDIVFIKTTPKVKGGVMNIWAIGTVVRRNKYRRISKYLGHGIDIKYHWNYEDDNNGECLELSPLSDGYHQARTGTLFPEISTDVKEQILQYLPKVVRRRFDME